LWSAGRQRGAGVGLVGPGGAQLVEYVGEPAGVGGRALAGRGGGGFGVAAGAVIGGLAGGVEAEVGAAAGLADVGAGGAGVLVEDQVAGVGGLPWMPCTVPA